MISGLEENTKGLSFDVGEMGYEMAFDSFKSVVFMLTSSGNIGTYFSLESCSTFTSLKEIKLF